MAIPEMFGNVSNGPGVKNPTNYQEGYCGFITEALPGSNLCPFCQFSPGYRFSLLSVIITLDKFTKIA
jgi:hypothetical protein